MNDHIVLFFPYFSGGMAALSIMFKLYKRSVSTFITFIGIAISSTLVLIDKLELGLLIMMALMIVMLWRAMVKNDNDTFLRQIKKRRRASDNA
jgi:hypothetical protein